MSTNDPPRRGPTLLPSIVALLVLLLALGGAFLFGRARANRGLGTALETYAQKSRLVSNMQLKLLASAEAEKSAVMAETDEESEAFAAESRRATTAVENDRQELGRLIEIGGRSDELQRSNQFSKCWTRYQEVDRQILDLAVENTNLKAQRLSFAPAAAAIDRMQAALDTLIAQAGAPAEAAVIVQAAYRALTAALKIHSLESRHIAEPRDAVMDRIEVEMNALDRSVNDAFGVLSASGGGAGKAAVDAARSAYADFQKVHTDVLALSRRNSNVRSLAISIGQKRKVTAECQDRLKALQDTVQKEVFKATR